MPSFITVGYKRQILGKGRASFGPLPHPWAAPKRPILNRVKGSYQDYRLDTELVKENILKWIGLSRLYGTLETSKLFMLLVILKWTQDHDIFLLN